MSAQFSELSEDQQNALMHYGVPGMKWGKRKASSSGSGGSSGTAQGGSQPKLKGKARSVAIKDARKRIIDTANKHNEGEYQSQMGLTAKDRQKGREMANKALRDLEQMDKNGDGRLANKMTRGEKVVSGLLWGATGAMIVGSAYSTSR